MFEKILYKESADHGGSEEWWNEMLQLRVMYLIFIQNSHSLLFPLVKASIWSFAAWVSID